MAQAPGLRPGALTQGKIDRSRSFWDKLIELPLVDSSDYVQEADCMILTSEAGGTMSVLDQSNGVANEHFAGIAISDFRRVVDFVATESTTVPAAAAFTYQLANSTPVAGTFYIENASGTVLTDVSPGAPGSATQYRVSTSGLVEFHSAAAGIEMPIIRYTYIPTVVQMEHLFYQRPIVAQGQNLLNQVAIAVGQCHIYTTGYNTEDTFVLNGRVYTGANGKFTTDATAVQVAGMVISLPSVHDVYLGVAYNTVVPGTLTF